MKTSRTWYFIFLFYLFVSYSCKDERAGVDDMLPTGITTELKAVANASESATGSAEIILTATEPVTVKCANCGAQFPLNFQPYEENPRKLRALFSYPYVDRTMLCKFDLEVKSDGKSKVRKIKYGVYLCPVAKNGTVSCDRLNALETCNLNQG